jgi:hypothetical protein
MPAQRLIHFKKRIADDLVKEVKVWRLPEPLPGSAHPYKYSLALIANGRCVLRYDNERGKGDHKHLGELETPIEWTSLNALLADFDRDIQCWRQAIGNADD